MEEPIEEHRVIPELYFLIAKFLSGGPLKETAKTLLKELESVEVLPRRLDWEGAEHPQSYDELASRYEDLPWDRLVGVCARALRLARGAEAAAAATSVAAAAPAPAAAPAVTSQAATERSLKVLARLSLLSDSLVRDRHKYASHLQDHTIVRRLVRRELGVSPAVSAGGRGGHAMFPPRMLSGLQLQRRTLGHLSAVYCLVFDCTGRYVVTGADDLLVKVWSAVDGRLLSTFRGAGAEITDVCVSRDGQLLAAGSVERLVRVWSLVCGAPKAVLSAHQGTITSVHWAPGLRGDVRWLASTSTDGSVAFWTCSADGQFLSQPVQYVERMRPGACHMICAAWSAGGAFLAAGSADHHVRIYQLPPGAGPPRRVLETAVHGDAVDSLSWARGGLRLVSGSKDGSAALWALHATQWRHTLLRCEPAQPDHDQHKRLKVTMVCWDCSDAYVITAVSDNTIRVWCSLTCTQVRSLCGHRDEVYVLEAHPFLPGVVLSAGHDGQLFVWDTSSGEVIAKFHNEISGQGDGAIFDAKWGGACTVAASDSHGHLLLLGLGQGHQLLKTLPTELFFHTDYRPLVRDALGGALDEQTETPPHLMPPPFLVDVEGAPHDPEFQRLVPGRENLALDQLIPAADAARSRLDLMIEALAGDRSPPPAGNGVWRGEGVRHTLGSWQSGEPMPLCTRPIVTPLARAARDHVERTSQELNQWEQAWWRREMRRRPLMISTGGEAHGGRRRAGRRPARPPQPPQPRPRPLAISRVLRSPEPDPEESCSSDTSDESVRLSGSDRSDQSRDRTHARQPTRKRYARTRSDRNTVSHTSNTDDTSISYSDSKTEESSESSQYSDWEAGAALAPPARARRRPLPTKRYSPSAVTAKRGERSALAGPGPAPAQAAAAMAPEPAAGAAGPSAGGAAAASAPVELPEAFRPGEWLCAVSPRKAPYHPQMGDHCLYFRLGHQRYFEAVAEKDVYKINPRDKPWERAHVYECEAVKVVGIKYVIKPPRVVCLRLACSTEPLRTRSLTVRYHDMPDVIDFLVLRQQYDAATQRHWGQGDRFRCMIDDSWWTGIVLERVPPSQSDSGAGAGSDEAREWAAAAAAHFLSLKVRWDNGEVERLSPWDLEPLDPERLPAEPGGAVPVLPHELEAALYRAELAEWPPGGDRGAACRAIARHVGQVMCLSVAEPFVAPVDLQLYPSYAMVVPYPIDLSTIKARFDNLFYRRAAAAQFDVRYLASNAEQFNQPHSPIVRQARLVTDLLLHIISHWNEVDVVTKYHELAAAYQSSDDEPLAHQATKRARASSRSGEWKSACANVLRELMASSDSEPFRRPVSTDQAPDYHQIIEHPMDLGTIQSRLSGEEYSSAEQFVRDVRLVFTNSRAYNTNKRSRIYSMTVRLSALFESLWSRAAVRRRGACARQSRRSAAAARARPTRALQVPRIEPVNGVLALASESEGSSSEPLAMTSRRVHAGRGASRPRDVRARSADDSWDSDAPLHVHSKGKGVGKKSKSNRGSPEAGPSRAPDEVMLPEYCPSRNGLDSDYQDDDAAASAASNDAAAGAAAAGAAVSAATYSSDSLDPADCHIEVLEEELLEEEVQLTYSPQQSADSDAPKSARKRRLRSSVSSCVSERSTRARRRRRRGGRERPPKRLRERFSEGSSTSSSSNSEGAASARRYESDRSYKPRYSTDDDAPLNTYRQRQEASTSHEAGPSGSTRRAQNGHVKRGVSLRERRSPRRYNEDSEEDSVAAISKRQNHHHHRIHNHHQLATRRQRHAAQASARAAAGAAGGAGAARDNDHNYFNGHAAHAHSSNGGRSERSERSERRQNSEEAPVSISSRGRVRKLTAKARGLLRD